jgi:hypothetical protein
MAMQLENDNENIEEEHKNMRRNFEQFNMK